MFVWGRWCWRLWQTWRPRATSCTTGRNLMPAACWWTRFFTLLCVPPCPPRLLHLCVTPFCVTPVCVTPVFPSPLGSVATRSRNVHAHVRSRTKTRSLTDARVCEHAQYVAARNANTSLTAKQVRDKTNSLFHILSDYRRRREVAFICSQHIFVFEEAFICRHRLLATGSMVEQHVRVRLAHQTSLLLCMLPLLPRMLLPRMLLTRILPPRMLPPRMLLRAAAAACSPRPMLH